MNRKEAERYRREIARSEGVVLIFPCEPWDEVKCITKGHNPAKPYGKAHRRNRINRSR